MHRSLACLSHRFAASAQRSALVALVLAVSWALAGCASTGRPVFPGQRGDVPEGSEGRGPAVTRATEAVRQVEVAMRRTQQELDAVRFDRDVAEADLMDLRISGRQRMRLFRLVQHLQARERELSARYDDLAEDLVVAESSLGAVLGVSTVAVAD